MLKIKGNTDLKKLEKFSFKKVEVYNEKVFGTKTGYTLGNRDYEHDYEINVNPRGEIEIKVNAYRSLDGYEFELLDIPNILYDLIKADLVEKVD